MKFTVNRSSLLRELQFLQSVTERKSTIPILSSLRFSATTRAGDLNIHGTDLDSHLMTYVDGTIEEPGECCIPAKKLHDIVKALPEAEIKFSVDSDKVHITCERSKFRLATMDASNFPQAITPSADLLPFPADTLKTLLSRVRMAASQEESRYSLNAIKFEYADGVAQAVATDSHRLAMCSHSAYYEGAAIEALIPIKTVDAVIKLADTKEPAMIGIENTLLFFSFGKRTLISRTNIGQYPNYRAILIEWPESFILDSDRFEGLLRRTALVTDATSRGCSFLFTGDQLSVVAESAEVGKAEGEMDIFGVTTGTFPEDGMRIGLNAQYVLDYIGAAPVGKLKIGMKDNQSAICMSPAEEEGFDFRYIVMPMRI